MPRDFAAALNDIDAVLADYVATERTKRSDQETLVRLITSLSACIGRWGPAKSPYRAQLAVPYDAGSPRSLAVKVLASKGTLEALRADYAAGRMVSVAELIHGELFSDYLEMATHLLDQGYKDAAAVIVGSTLEAHLHALCAKYSVPTARADGAPKKASIVNDELRAAGAYELGDQKQVTAWLNLRNDAAHGDYEKYDEARVALMRDGVQNFIVRIPA